MKSKSLFLPRIEAFQAVMAAFGEDILRDAPSALLRMRVAAGRRGGNPTTLGVAKIHSR